MKLFVGCSSRDNIPSKYFDDCKTLLEELFVSGCDLVFGACSHGLMGLTYNIALNNSSGIVGIYPEIYKSEADNLQCLKIPVKTISERTEKLIVESDALIFLPGGIGTMYELLMAIESKRGKEHNKPIIIYNCYGYFDKILEQLDVMYKDGFASEVDKNEYFVCCSSNEAREYLNNYYSK